MLNEYKAMIEHWWKGREPREQKILGVGGIVVALILMYFLLWQPIHDAIEKKQRTVAQQETLLNWISEQRIEIQRLQATNPTALEDYSGSLFSLLEQSLKQYQLYDDVADLSSSGNNNSTLRFDAVEFDELITWLNDMETRYGIQTNDMRVVRLQTPGQVQASLELSRVSPS